MERIELIDAVTSTIVAQAKHLKTQEIGSLYDELVDLIGSTSIQSELICLSTPPKGSKVIKSKNFQVFYNDRNEVKLANKFF